MPATISRATTRSWSLLLYGVVLLKLTAYLYFKFGLNTQELPGTIGSDGLYKYFPLKKALQPARTFFSDNSMHFTLQPHDDGEWESLIPGDGLVYLGPDKQPYTISVIHQLRCIDIIRRGMYDVTLNPTSDVERPTPLQNHCVNYLRQMIQCRADLDFDFVSGRPYPNVHPKSYECADFHQLFEAIEENQRAAK